jgi:zinc protease
LDFYKPRRLPFVSTVSHLQRLLPLCFSSFAVALAASSVAGALATEAHARAATAQKAIEFALQNGMDVIVVPDHRAPIVTQMIWFKVGAADDPPGLGGLAHFFEHMMFRGTRTVPGEGYAQAIARNGGDENAFTTHDYTCFYEQIAKDRLRMAMALEADRMANLDLSDSNVNTERQIVLEERRMRVDNSPQALVDEQAHAALYLSHPYGRPVVGWPEEVRRIGRVEAQDFYDHHYAPNNAILIVAGDVTSDEVRSDAQASYAKLPARPLVPRAEYAQPPRLAETRMMVLRSDANVPYFSRTYRVVSYADAATGQAEALDVFAELLGGNTSSALYRTLVVEKRLATDAGATYEGMARDAGEFTVYAVPRPGVPLDVLERGVDQVIAPFAQNQPSPADLTRAKVQLVASAVYRRDNQYSLASAYGEALAVGLTVTDVEDWPSRIRAVTGASVLKQVQSALDKREAVSAYLVPHGAK